MNKLLLPQQALKFGFRQFSHNFLLLMGISFVSIGINFGMGRIFLAILQTPSLKVLAVSTLPESTLTKVAWSAPFSTITKFAKKEKLLLTSDQQFWLLIIIALSIVTKIIGMLLQLGWNRIGLDIYDHGTSHFSRLLAPISRIPSYLLGSIIYFAPMGMATGLITQGLLWLDSISIIPLIPLLLAKIVLSSGLIIGMCIFGIRYSFFDLAIIDTNCSFWESFSISARLTYNFKWLLFFTYTVMALIYFLTLITAIIPFILLYVYYLSRVYLYRRLQAYHHLTFIQVNTVNEE